MICAVYICDYCKHCGQSSIVFYSLCNKATTKFQQHNLYFKALLIKSNQGQSSCLDNIKTIAIRLSYPSDLSKIIITKI